MARIEIVVLGQAPKTLVFNRPQITIGRQDDNDIVLSDVKASRRHCVIEMKNGGILLRDLKSHNGTWIGGNRVIEAKLSLGETLRIGDTMIRVLPEEIETVDAEAIPTAEVVLEDDDEDVIIEAVPTGSADKSLVARTLAAQNIVRGPLSKQLAPLMQACIEVAPALGAPESMRDLRLLNRKSEPVKVAEGAARSSEALDSLKQLLFVAFRTRATDIHIEPKAEIYSIRFRIDGLMHAVGEVTPKVGSAILNVIKILCEQDISKRTIVQEGSFAVELPTRRVDFRISLTPTTHGQKLALRFLDKATVPSQFENLGMDLDAVAELTRICQMDSGVVILAGPTGSGKTTTLYTALGTIDARTRNIVTIEDPVEYELVNTTQISIDARHNVTFASVLGTILRQDPDVILVGEVRDEETAKMAMQAAMTGHLVLTTIHARDTVGTIFRLLDLGVEPFLVANAMTLCISQRLVRVLCPNCKRPFRPDPSMIRRMNLEGRPHGDFYEAVGCRKCMNTGYRGRMALFEMLLFTPQVRDVILSGPTIGDIRKAAGEWMFHSLTESGYRKVIEGVTTIQEVDRVAGMV